MMFGFLIGIKHALEGDHIAAVAALAADGGSFRHALKQGTAWGLGHTLTLFAVGSLVIVLDASLPERFADWLEFAVGVMLVLLGLDVLRRVVRDRIHFHTHGHGGGEVHLHAHSHRGEEGHTTRHRHRHPSGVPLRALFIGMMHGMAGSAALLLLTATTIQSPWLGMLYIAIFGVGSITGMAAFSVVIAVPLRASAKGMTWMHNGLQAIIGGTTIVLGAVTMAAAA
jgi:sulfite exporter TauE/SafE